ncbi:dosage compensation regulator [Manduca sexta]|uniref:dosage compensation regulator n=1 Tax=Manduca sexta TaxID=7130 RepID=UPI00188E25FA|nr:dosage compensation regulator [Manduca sexta]
MDISKLVILLCCTYYSIASHHSHTIPIEGYETELQVLGQHVDIPETPVKVVKITKTIAVKIPVPYPVKVREKVPYPVPIAKPYPVPVPQIIKVPHIISTKGNYGHDGAGSGSEGAQSSYLPGGQGGNSYGVQEIGSDNGNSFAPSGEGHAFEGGNSGYNQNAGSFGDEYEGEGYPGGSYGGPSQSYNGYSNNNNVHSLY